MQKKVWLNLLGALALSAASLNYADNHVDIQSHSTIVSDLKPPIAAKQAHETKLHGVTLIDHYHWMRHRDDPQILPDILSYVNEWNAYTKSFLEPIKPFQEQLYKEMVSRNPENFSTYPYRIGNYSYYTRTETGKDYPINCRKKVGCDSEEIILDQNILSQTYPYFKAFSMAPSPDGRYVAFVIDVQGTAHGNIFIFESKAERVVIAEQIPNGDETIVWSHDSKGFWYVHVDDEMRSSKLLFHVIGQPVSRDECLYVENDELFEVQLSQSHDGRFVFATSVGKGISEVHYGWADDPSFGLILVHARQEAVLYYLEAHGDYFFIRCKEGRSNFGLWTAPIEDPSRDNWKLFLPPSSSVDLFSVHPFKDYLVILKEEEALTKVEVLNLKTGSAKEIQLPDPLMYSVAPEDNHQFHSTKLRLGYTSLLTPKTVLEYDMQENTLKVLQQEKFRGFTPSDYTMERHYAYAKDGTRIPISLFYKKGIVLDGTTPLLLHAYGAYGWITSHSYTPWLISMADHGIYAFAHVRGGGDCGRRWHEDGKLMNKMNSFTDFICCAEHLIQEGYTSRGRLAIYGRSAGGLLIGAVLNMRPDLFKAALAEVPFVDAVNSMADRTIPFTKLEEVEWGSCSDERVFKYILKYSPYDNISRQEYPAIMVTGGWHDLQVCYWEPSKWAAKLLEHKTDSSPLLLHINMEGGHMGPGGRYHQYQDKAMKLAFLLSQLGI